MRSKWMVKEEYIGGKKMYGIYRLRDVTKEDWTGNIESGKGYFPEKESAEQLAERLNRKERKEQ